MYLLAFETSFGKFSITLFHDGKVADYYACEKENEQAELLIPSIEIVLERNSLTYFDINYIAVSIGPGSFTGLRIGIAAAKGMALAAGIKLIGVSTLEASALLQNAGKVYLNASRGDAFYQEFSAGLKPLGEAQLVSYAGPYSPLPDSTAIGRVALMNLDNPNKAEPLYVRKPDAKFKLRNATMADLEWLATLHKEAFTTAWKPEMFKQPIESGQVIIADRVGFIIYEIIGEEAEIKTIVTSQHARRNGVANFLLKDMLKNLQEKKILKLFLEVEHDNIAAVKLYEKLGFKKFSERKNYYGTGRNALLMQLQF